MLRARTCRASSRRSGSHGRCSSPSTEKLAEAVHVALCTADAPARRLRRALDWFRIALSNGEAVSPDVRVGAARSAFEILTEAGGETKRLVRAYGRLVGEGQIVTATYNDVFWAKGPVPLTPDEWWMTRLCALRNAVVHGDRVPDELWDTKDTAS